MAGHPTVGTAYVLARDAIAEMLSIDPAGLDDRYPVEVVSTGVPFLFVPLRDRATIEIDGDREQITGVRVGGQSVYVGEGVMEI